jgi:uncharacterized protein YndB with AHSA1/START domain
MTMQLFKHTIWIAKPRNVVFDYFIDFEQAARWRSYVRTMELVGPGPLRQGSKVHCVMDVGGEAYEFDLEVLTFERPSLWRHRTNETDYLGAIEYRFEPEEQGTRVTMSCNVKPVGLYGWLGMPLMWLRRGKSYKEQLPQLKRAMEGGST